MQVQDIQDIPMEINYTIIEPKNDYRSDIYSPWQTKLQLEIWQEVNPSKVKVWSEYLEAWIHTIKTRSKNLTIEITAINNDWDISTWILVWNIRNQKAVTRSWTMRKNRIYYFSVANKWKILKLFPWWFVIEVQWNPVTINYKTYNVAMQLDKLPQEED